jgi:hypothetical protein
MVQITISPMKTIVQIESKKLILTKFNNATKSHKLTLLQIITLFTEDNYHFCKALASFVEILSRIYNELFQKVFNFLSLNIGISW